MKSFLKLLLVLGLLLPGRAQETLPDPSTFGRSDSLAIFVVRARSEDNGFRQMLATAINGAQAQKGAPSLASFLSSFLSLRSQEEMLLAALPLQWVRVDSVGPDGRLLSNVAITLAGWRGFQTLIYNALTAGPEGKPYDKRLHQGEEIVLRDGWQSPGARLVLARVKGTFLNCSTPDQARYQIDRLLGKDHSPLQGPLWQAYSQLAQDKDAFGVIVNRSGSLLKVLEWVNRADTQRVREKLGSERFERAAELVESASWEADVVSDDRIDIEVRFATAGRPQAEELALLLEEAREVLDQEGRMGDFYLTMTPEGVKIGFAMVGFHDLVSRYLGTVRI